MSRQEPDVHPENRLYGKNFIGVLAAGVPISQPGF
jgi:hypothetical protein